MACQARSVGTTRDYENARESAKWKGLVRGNSKYHRQRCIDFQRLAFIWLVSCVLFQSLRTWAFSPLQIPRKVSFRHSKPLFYRLPGFQAKNGNYVDLHLQERLVTFEAEASKEGHELPSFKEVWGLLRKELPNGGDLLPGAEEALPYLKAIMNKEYSSEQAFDKNLFKAMEEYLMPYALPQKDSNSIVLNLGAETRDYAVGIARQKSPAEYITQHEPANNDAGHQSSAASSERNNDHSIPDHSVCLYRNDANKWSPTDCFSLVELRTSASTCGEFDFQAWNGVMLPPRVSGRHLALGQVTLFNLWFVLTCRAKRGVLGDQIPLAVIAGKKKKWKKHLARHFQQGEMPTQPLKQLKGKLRWVSGHLHVPEACGGSFQYSVQDFGHFSDDDESAERALALYLYTLWYGLVAAIKVQKELADGEVPGAVASSGQSIVIGNMTLNLQLCASPIPSAVPSQDHRANTRWKISHGDLFQGRLNVGEVLHGSGAYILDFCNGRSETMGAANVLVKVTSATVHHPLIRPRDAYSALDKLHYMAKSELQNEIGTVLFAFVPMGLNLITIMNDLTQEGYETLKPINHIDKLDILWGGFQDLVVRLLLPLAQLGIIHADIRPGNDETSSILSKLMTADDGKVTKANMKLIDFESLVVYLRCESSCVNSQKMDRWDATTYVWWQCMAVAYAWKESLNATSLGRYFAIDTLKHFLLDGFTGPTWLNKYRDFAKGRISAEVVEMTLMDLAGEFS